MDEPLRRTRVYRNHHLDSTRWDGYRPRPGDVVISTSVKAGTTWMQRILSLLVFGPGDLPCSLWEVSPWLDQRFIEPVEDVLERLEAQEHRRFIKSHLPLDALPYHEEVRYIVVGRDTRDVFMSLWNHYRAYTQTVYELLDAADPEAGPMPRCPDDARRFWRDWITRTSFPWEPDGWPFWSHHYHAASWWPHRRLDNVLLVHFNDLLRDLDGEMRRVAEFCGIDADPERWPELVEAARFDAMKADASKLLPRAEIAFDGGPERFIYKGTNGRWRDVLAPEDLELYEDAASQALPPDARRWLESGRLAELAEPS